MARKPPLWRQPLLDFSQDSDETPEPHQNVSNQPTGEQHALQDDDSRTAPRSPTDLRPAAPQPDTAADARSVCPGVKEPPRPVAGASLPDEAGQRREPDRGRGAGTGPPGTGGSFALRVAAGRNRT